jgi:RNA polymerase sigma-70 factor (ECF subfamily)
VRLQQAVRGPVLRCRDPGPAPPLITTAVDRGGQAITRSSSSGSSLQSAGSAASGRPTPDADGFGAALAAELPRLARLAIHLTRDPATAEELAQEAALRAWARRRQLRDGAPVGPWLNRILLNLVIDRSRAHRDELTVADIEDRWHDDDYTVDPEQVLARAELRDELEDALVRLPAGYRTVVVLHDAAGWPVPAIAEALRIGLSAAKQRLRRGRMMLVSVLADGDPKRAASLAQPLHCWRARRHISAYLDEELEPETRAAVEGHLAVCPTCPPLYTSLVGLRAHMGELRDPDSVVPDGIAERIAARIRQPGPRRG